eukprot:3643648-Pyramimonas_sp.AAC.1
MAVPRELLPVAIPAGPPPAPPVGACSRAARSRLRRKEHLHAWVQEVLVSVDELHGHGSLP